MTAPTPADSQPPDQQPPRSPAVEGRGIWIEMKTLPPDHAGIHRLVASLARCHFNLLLVEVNYEGASLYPSALVQQDARFTGKDLLASLIAEAHTAGLEVHAWMWAMKQGRYRSEDAHPGGPVLTRHPDWMAVNRQGQAVSPGSSYYWLCPTHPQARAFLQAEIDELMSRYPLDGIHLDYIRYERALTKGAPPPYCYCARCRAAYQSSRGVDPITLQPYTRAFRDWYAWRENQLTSLVAQIARRVRERNSHTLLSAAVYPDPQEARRCFGQNWPLWVQNHSLDFVVPMLYRDQTDQFVRRLQHYNESGLSRQGVVLAGVGVNAILKRIFSHDVLIEQVRAARTQGMLGNVLFSYSVMTPYLEQFLINEVYPTYASVPFRDLEQGAQTLQLQATSQPSAVSAWLLARAADLQAIAVFQRQAPLRFTPPPPLEVVGHLLERPRISLATSGEGAAPAVDGSLSDPCWSTARALPLQWDADGREAPIKTWAKMLVRDNALYAAFRCETAETDTDVVALYLDPGPSFSEYLVLSVDAQGMGHLERVPDGSYRPPGVESPETVPRRLPWKCAVRRGQGFWSAEMRVPLASLLGSSHHLGLNVVRSCSYQGRPHWLEWSVTYGSPYNPLRFGCADLL